MFFLYKLLIECKRLTTSFLLCSEEICCIVIVNYLWSSSTGYKTTNGGHAQVLTQGTCNFEIDCSAHETGEDANIPSFCEPFFHIFEWSDTINAQSSKRIMVIISMQEPARRQNAHVRLLSLTAEAATLKKQLE